MASGQPHFSVRAASNGFDFLTAWVARTPHLGWQVYTRAVRADGSLIGSHPSPLQTDGQETWGVSLSRGRDGYFAAWITFSAVNAAVVDSFGRVERRTSVDHHVTNPYGATFSAWSGTTYLVVASIGNSTSGILFDNDANVLRTAIPIANRSVDSMPLALTADTTGFLVVAAREETDGGWAMYGLRISPSGTPGEWFLVRRVASAVTALATAYDGAGRFSVAWSDMFGVWALALDSAGTLVAERRQLAPAGRVGGVAVAAGQTFVAYDDSIATVAPDGTVGMPRSIDAADVIATNGTAVLSAGLVGGAATAHVIAPLEAGPIQVGAGPAAQTNGRLATAGDQIAAVWDEVAREGTDVYFNVVGSISPGPGVRLSESGINTTPDVAWNGQSWLVVWNQLSPPVRRILARRVSAAGEVLDAAPIVLAEGESWRPRVASDGVSWLVVWIERLQQRACGNVGSATRVVAARVDSTGRVVDEGGIRLPSIAYDAQAPELVWNGSKYVIAFAENCFRYRGTSYSVVAGTITSDLTEIDLHTIGSGGPSEPRLVVGRSAVLVAWQRDLYPGRYAVSYLLMPHVPPLPTARRRSVGRAVLPPIEGRLAAVSTDAEGRPTIITRRPLSGAEGEGWYETEVNDDATTTERFLRTIGRETIYTGNIVRTSGGRFLAEGRFDLNLGTQLMWLWDF